MAIGQDRIVLIKWYHGQSPKHWKSEVHMQQDLGILELEWIPSFRYWLLNKNKICKNQAITLARLNLNKTVEEFNWNEEMSNQLNKIDIPKESKKRSWIIKTYLW